MTIRIQETILPNGLRVITDPMDSVESVSVGVWVNVGTRNEAPEINGISHLLEHMAFKGTPRRSARAIAEEIEAVGGHLNAYTSREQTAYYAKVLKEDSLLALDIIADILQNSVMDAEELAREQAVVLQEIGQTNDTPDDIIFDHFQATAYPDQALGRPVLGTAELVNSVKRETLLNYMGSHYGADRMILAASGRIDHDTLCAQASDLFKTLPKTSHVEEEKAHYRGGVYREERDLEQVHIVLGFDGVAYDDPDFYTAMILSTLLGGGMSSRLFQEIREKQGLVYSIYSFSSSYADGGLFGVYAGTGESDVTELMPLLCDEIMKTTQSIDGAEVARARAQVKAGLLMGLESPSSRAEQLARQIQAHGRIIPLEESLAHIEAVDESAVISCARRLFSAKGKDPVLAAIGPLGRLESFSQTCARLG